MREYEVSFSGKKKGAIGISTLFSIRVVCEHAGEISRVLYENYEHISFPQWNVKTHLTGPNHARNCPGLDFYYSGSGYNRVRVCNCGAEDHDPE